MKPVGFANTRILTDYARKSPRSLTLPLNKCCKHRSLIAIHTYWCRLPTNDFYQQGPLLGVFYPVRANGCNYYSVVARTSKCGWAIKLCTRHIAIA